AMEEAGDDAVSLELGAREMAEHGRLGRGRHGLEVVRRRPVLRRRRMDGEAEVVPDVLGVPGWLHVRVTIDDRSSGMKPWPYDDRRQSEAAEQRRSPQPAGPRNPAGALHTPWTASAPGPAIRTARQ